MVCSALLDMGLLPNSRIIYPASISALQVRMEVGRVGLYKIFIGWPKTQLQWPHSLFPLVYAGAAANGRDREQRLTTETLSV